MQCCEICQHTWLGNISMQFAGNSDLGIFADSCYDAFSKTTSITASLDRRADQAYVDIVDRHNEDAPDGSVQFKRRFAEMSRSGQRVINTDQTMQLIRNENLKAEMRSESDRALMMILTAVIGQKKKPTDETIKEEEDDDDDDDDDDEKEEKDKQNLVS